MTAISANDTGLPATCAPDTRSRIYALSADLTQLVGMIEGVAVLYDAVDSNAHDNPIRGRAANAMPALLERVIQEAHRINGALDDIEMEGIRHDI